MTPRCEFLMYLEDRNSKESIVDYHYKKMEEFKNEALEKLTKHLGNNYIQQISKSLAIACIDGYQGATQMFYNQFNLNDAHLYALMDDFESFEDEYEKL